MPPRISLPVRLRTPSVSSRTSPAVRAFSTTPTNYATTAAQRRRHQDPYAQAQAKARKDASLSRQAVLNEQRKQALGDPVRGITTPFVESFDTALPQQSTPTSKNYLNHFLRPHEVEAQLAISQRLATPTKLAEELPASVQEQANQVGRAKSKSQVEQEDANATAAIQRIVSLSNSNSKDRTRVNVQRCIATFGRHQTDKTLPPRPIAARMGDSAKLLGKVTKAPNPELYTRGGPDTGSSEVQIAILTAKIRTLANYLETRGKNDKVNKRNLRLLVHRRQKLLNYLRKKERGGPRWENLIKKLGLTEGTWKGEISL
ncbi:Ribosomal protein S15 [Neofusicoccum parvum]|nr:Ribosomal protein S15 [Neofusicoccum parvum]